MKLCLGAVDMKTCPTTINLIRRFHYVHVIQQGWGVGGKENTPFINLTGNIQEQYKGIYKILMGDKKEVFPLKILNSFSID